MTDKRRDEPATSGDEPAVDTPIVHADLNVVVVRRQASPERWARLVRLLSILMDKHLTPDDAPAEKTGADD